MNAPPPVHSPAERAPAGARLWVPIRTLGERHRPRATDHLLALGEQDRIWRFGHLASDDRIRHYTEQMDFANDQIFGVFDRGLQVVALAHLAFDGERGTAEFGVSVSAGARGQGLGSHLFGNAVTHARNRGVHTMHIHLARDNAAMLGIVRRAGARVDFDGGEGLARLTLPEDTLGSQLQELLGHQAAEFDYRLKRQARRLEALRSPAP